MTVRSSRRSVDETSPAQFNLQNEIVDNVLLLLGFILIIRIWNVSIFNVPQLSVRFGVFGYYSRVFENSNYHERNTQNTKWNEDNQKIGLVILFR